MMRKEVDGKVASLDSRDDKQFGLLSRDISGDLLFGGVENL